MDEEITLKPCPFCGKEASPNGVIRRASSPDCRWADGTECREAFYCNCMSCGANNRGIAGGYQTRDKAVSHWNTRAVLAQPQEPQMTAAERDAFTRAQQEFDNGETVPAPAPDVVKKVAIAIAQEDGYGRADADWIGSPGKVYLAQAAAALAVAREGMVPASELEKAKAGWNHALNRWDEENCKRNALIDEVATLKQQLATMYSLEQVEKAAHDEIHAALTGTDVQKDAATAKFMSGLLKRLTAKPTEQEKVKAIDLALPIGDVALGLGIAAKILAALSKGGK